MLNVASSGRRLTVPDDLYGRVAIARQLQRGAGCAAARRGGQERRRGCGPQRWSRNEPTSTPRRSTARRLFIGRRASMTSRPPSFSLRAGATVTASNRYAVTPLSLACMNGNAGMIGLLLKAGADANTALPGGETALMTTARTGSLEGVKLLLAHGADVNAKEAGRGQTALMWATSEGHTEVVRLLLEQRRRRQGAFGRRLYPVSVRGQGRTARDHEDAAGCRRRYQRRGTDRHTGLVLQALDRAGRPV